MSDERAKRGRIQFLLIAAVFLGPLLIAAWMYYSGALNPDSTANRGSLLEPIVNLNDSVPGSPLLAQRRWLLLYADTAFCGDRCLESLYALRQSRLMLGREMDRVQRVFLHGDEPPDNLLTAEEHKGLISLQDDALRNVLDNKKPPELADGGYFLIDPHGNLVMYFDPGINPREMVDDIKRLLRLSRIG